MAKKIKRGSYAYVHKLAAGVALLCFAVIMISGFMSELSVTTIAYRSVLVMLAVSLISRIVVSILATYEEMNSGNEA